MSELKHVDIYTDGACSGNPGAGGWAAILVYNGVEKTVCGYNKDTTNNRMEIQAVIEGLKALKMPCIVELYSDSKYVIDALRLGWATKWRSNGWMRSGNQPARNIDLWKELLALTEVHTVNCHWVKGHADNVFNNRCDEMAVRYRKQLDGEL